MEGSGDDAAEEGGFDIGHPAAAGDGPGTSLEEADAPAALLALVQQLPALTNGKDMSARGLLLRSVLAKVSCRDGRTGAPVDLRLVRQELGPLLRAAVATRSLRASTAAALLADLFDTDRGMTALLKRDGPPAVANGYQLFVQKTAGELRADSTFDGAMTDILKIASARWKALSDKKRAKWKRRGERAKAATGAALQTAKEAAVESAAHFEYALPQKPGKAPKTVKEAAKEPRGRKQKLGWRRMAEEADGFGAYFNDKFRGDKYRALSQFDCEAKLRRRWAKLSDERRADYALRSAETVDEQRRSHNQYSRDWYRRRREASRGAGQSAIAADVEPAENGGDEAGAGASNENERGEEEDAAAASPKRKKSKKAKSKAEAEPLVENGEEEAGAGGSNAKEDGGEEAEASPKRKKAKKSKKAEVKAEIDDY